MMPFVLIIWVIIWLVEDSPELSTTGDGQAWLLTLALALIISLAFYFRDDG